MSTLFKYETQGRLVTYLDSDDVYKPEDVRQSWQAHFPDLGNSQTDIKQAKKDEKLAEMTAEGQEVKVDKVVTFVKKVGTKGGPDAVEADFARIRDAIAVYGDPVRKRLIDAAPKMLAELRAQRDLLKTILEVAVFYNGNRQVVIDQLGKLEAVIAEATGAEIPDDSR